MEDTCKQIKQQLRAAGIAARKAILPQQRSEWNLRICEQIAAMQSYLDAKAILFYHACNGEVDVETLADAARKDGKLAAYPLCVEQFGMRALIPRQPNAWVAGKYGIATPDPARSDEIAPEKLDLVIVPCTAFDASKGRIGMGAGYYDRFLIRCVHAVTILVAYEAQRIAQTPCNTYDVMMDYAVSERQIYQ